MGAYKSIEWLEPGIVRMLDQHMLPGKTVYNDYKTAEEVAEAITTMVIRGAPAIGKAAAFGLVLTGLHYPGDDVAGMRSELSHSAEVL
jgi:methylthioribose-1-phosphate isomerase